MKKRIALLSVFLMLFTTLQLGVYASTAIKVFINGKELQADQGPVIVEGRTLVPLRAIFEALDAQVNWNPATRTVVATKGDVTITLKEGSKTAKINNISVTLDVAAMMINGRTMVPGRFVSEALGAQVSWDAATKRVYIKTQQEVKPASQVTARDIGDHGDGRDVEISFTRSPDETNVSHYRVYLVKTHNANQFDLATAQAISSNHYTLIFKTGSNISTVLHAQARDVEGALIQENMPYTVFVLTVGNEKVGNKSVLSAPSQPFLLVNYGPSSPATNVKVSDISDYGDGRDLQVTFTKAKDEDKVAYYRILVVKSKDASKFNLAKANQVPNQYSMIVAKTGSNISTVLGASARDVNGEAIKNGVSYTVFILSVKDHSNVELNRLSAASPAITLSNNAKVSAPTNLKVSDVSDYGDGRDLQVSFTKSADESRVSFYRIFVVKSGDAGSFGLADANKVAAGNYFDVAKTGSNISVTLPAHAKDVKGAVLRNGVAYKVFVMAVGTEAVGYKSALSAASTAITLSTNHSAIAITNLKVSDVSDYGDGRDLKVTFNKSSDEAKIDHYRVMVVKSANANSFNLTSANAVPSSNYTYVHKTGNNLSLTLASNARDVDGVAIRNGVAYKVFVLSVANGNQAGVNALSQASATITLSSNAVSAVTNVEAKDINNYGDGRDLEVSFTKSPDEGKISQYRIMVVPAQHASQFNLATANQVASGNYTVTNKTGSNIKRTLSHDTKDVFGNKITGGVTYRVFVLAVADGVNASINALSSPSANVQLSDPSVSVATNVTAEDIGNNGNGLDLKVSFNKAANESNISSYAIMVVKAANAASFNLQAANAVPTSNYTTVLKTGSNVSVTLAETAKDVDGDVIRNGVAYKVFVLSIADGTNATVNSLSSPSGDIILRNQ